MFRSRPTGARPEERSELERIQRLSVALSRACLVLIVVLPLLVPLYWALADAGLLAAHASLDAGAIQQPLQTWQRVAGALLTELPVAFMSLGLWHARVCFSGFAHRRIFTAEAVRCLRGFAAWSFASALSAVGVGALTSVVLTLGNPVGSRHVALAVDSDQVLTLFFAATVWLMAAVIAQGRALADENAAFL